MSLIKIDYNFYEKFENLAPDFKKPLQISKFSKEIGFLGRRHEIPDKVDLKTVHEKFIKNQYKSLEELKRIFRKREIKLLCFCLGYGENSLLDSPAGAKALDLICNYGLSSKSSLPGLMWSYSEYYEPSKDSFLILQNSIQSILNSIESPNLYEKHLLDFEAKIFAIFPHNEMANHLKFFEGNLLDFFSSFGFHFSSKISKETIVSFLKIFSSIDDFEKKLPILLQDLSDEAAPEMSSIVANTLLEDFGIDAPKKVKECMKLFLFKRLGDPRINKNNFRWTDVSENAKKVFSVWLNEDDLELFFDVVEKTCNDPNYKYRRAFWLSYADHIDQCIFCLSSQARRYLEKRPDLKDKDFRAAKGGGPEVSFFIMEMGEYVVVESSTGRACYIYNKNNMPFSLSSREFVAQEVLNREMVNKRIVHSGSSDYSWQKDLDNFILRNLNFRRNRNYREI